MHDYSMQDARIIPFGIIMYVDFNSESLTFSY